MPERSTSLAASRSRAAFSLWGWVTLLVILLSAAPTGGAMRTQVFGSAFDPATYSVTTAPKRHSLVSELQAESEGEPDEVPARDYPRLIGSVTLAHDRAAPRLGDSPRQTSDLAAVPPIIADNRAARAPPAT